MNTQDVPKPGDCGFSSANRWYAVGRVLLFDVRQQRFEPGVAQGNVRAVGNPRLMCGISCDVPWNNLAWLKATCPEEQFRNGAQAVEFATRTCEMTQWKNFATLSTLAAAYAEAGDFAAAVKWQEKSIELAPELIRPKLEVSLALFQEEKPLRETVKRPRTQKPDEPNAADGGT